MCTLCAAAASAAAGYDEAAAGRSHWYRRRPALVLVLVVLSSSGAFGSAFQDANCLCRRRRRCVSVSRFLVLVLARGLVNVRVRASVRRANCTGHTGARRRSHCELEPQASSLKPQASSLEGQPGCYACGLYHRPTSRRPGPADWLVGCTGAAAAAAAACGRCAARRKPGAGRSLSGSGCCTGGGGGDS